ncbi:MAG: TonB-dependent receptor, partial [Pseudomonadota bacterium]
FDIKDVFERTPNVTSANGDLSFTIRGIEARGVGADGSGTLINVQVDGASLPTQESITFGPYSTWDLEQVEILRGPQSTQQGRNALAGAVIFRSNDPTYDYELKGRGEIGNRETFGGAIAFNAPVIEDVLAVRFSAEHKETDGFVEAPTLGIDDYDPDELTTLRGKVLFEPVEGFSAILGASFSRNRTGEDAISFAEFPGRIVNLDNEAGEEGNDTGIFTLRMSYDLSDSLTLESETTGIINDYIRVEDLTGPVSFGQLNIQQDSSSWSQELRLVYEIERVSAVAGGFATGISSQTEIAATIGADFLISSLPPTIQFIRSSVSREETLNVAFFGEAEIEVPEISDGFSIIVGGRYDRETIDFESEGETQVTGELPFPLPIAGSTSTSSDTSFDAFLPKIGIVYDWSDDLSTGFTVQRGYRAGGTFESTVSGAISEWDPEFTWNYEFALRSQWFDRRLTANANLFYTEWTDQQVTVPNPSGIPLDFRAANAGESRLFGGELALSGTPIPELELFGSVGVTDTKFTDFVSGEDDFTGNRFTYAPVVSAAFGGRYFFDNVVSLGVDASYTGATFSQLSNSPADRVDSRFLLNASLGYETENWAIEAYVRNLLDNEYLVQQNSDDDFARAGEPLTFGLIGRFQF